ncbi:hypothetical protein RhiirA1_458856 [Rhizophagus irregularis]|uniref:Uncharacterized protein n=1 Tax=Rhizophagus irregularis TaxID=588596 RepID=A0A2I1ERV9_9GLOM|nr:hypothetical protein RhiirA1_458856 [Rhizophagus irregularis]PKY24857.1 hypothetical protein RhiirB3_439567 [Rhizophagus irregularis]CAB4476848.1 unnamed protein product [Rhizophagus irregularis]CAB5384364.1 unnamed protein product [Rhizophagus irregularis]
MNSNNNTCYDNYYNFSPSQNDRNDELNYQHSSDTISHHNHCVNIAASGSETFEFYYPLQNGPNGRVYYVTYTELSLYDIAKRLNNGINGIYTPNHQSPHHINVQNLIGEQIAQQNCNCSCSCNRNRQGTITIQPASFSNAYATNIGPSNMQNAGFEVSLQQNNYQQYQQ